VPRSSTRRRITARREAGRRCPRHPDRNRSPPSPPAVDTRLQLTREEVVGVAGGRTHTVPRHVVSNEAHRAPRLRACRIEAEETQQPQHVHRRVPSAVPRRAPHLPSADCSASRRAPHPSVATLARSAATSSAGAPVRSRITCHRIDGSASHSQRMSGPSGFGGPIKESVARTTGWRRRCVRMMPSIGHAPVHHGSYTRARPQE
jgi:hypothetical protein